MNENGLQIFEYNGTQMRTVERDGELWWVLKDVCGALSISDHKSVSRRLDEDEVGQIPLTDSIGRLQETTIINEAGLYNVILRSDKPEAKDFKRWVTHDVLPSIRRTGSYTMNKTLSPAELIAAQANLLVEHERKLSALEAETESIRRGVEDTKNKIVDAVSVFSAASFSPDTWQEEANRQINDLVESNNLNHQTYRRQLYDRLEQIAGVDLQMRQTRMKNRMKSEGKTVTQQKAVTKLYIIAQDKKLRPIFDSILREEKAKRVCAGWGA